MARWYPAAEAPAVSQQQQQSSVGTPPVPTTPPAVPSTPQQQQPLTCPPLVGHRHLQLVLHAHQHQQCPVEPISSTPVLTCGTSASSRSSMPTRPKKAPCPTHTLRGCTSTTPAASTMSVNPTVEPSLSTGPAAHGDRPCFHLVLLGSINQSINRPDSQPVTRTCRAAPTPSSIASTPPIAPQACAG
jgi:hypothetical protein